MARKGRVFVKDVAQYIALVTDQTDAMFEQQEDYEQFTSILVELCKESEVSLHAYTLLPQSFEALVTPHNSEAIAKFMQLLARRYVLYFNKKYNRSGSLWRRRYVSVLVDSEYIYEVIKYIETKSLNLVENEKRYPYSSIRANIGAEPSPIIEYHSEFSPEKYKQNYMSILTHQEWDFIDENIEKQYVIGSSRFMNRVEEEIGISLQSQGRGRPKKDNLKKRNTMYKNLVVLNKEQHKMLKISPITNLLFAKETTALPLVYKEISLVAKHYPVVFSNSEPTSFMVLVSLGKTNLAITEDGQWLGDYVPAVLRKYPFSVTQNSNDESKSLVLIDEGASILSKSKGKQLFKKSGESSDILSKSIDFAAQYEEEIQRTRMLTQEIKESGIMEEKEIRMNAEGETKALVNGFSVINEEKLSKLDKKLLEKWEKSGAMAIIKAHLASLKNVQTLFTLAKNRQV